MPMTNFKPGQRVRRTLTYVDEGTVDPCGTKATFDAFGFFHLDRTAEELGTTEVTYEILSEPEPPMGSVVLFATYGTVAQLTVNGWLTVGSSMLWTWNQLMNAVGPEFSVIS